MIHRAIRTAERWGNEGSRRIYAFGFNKTLRIGKSKKKSDDECHLDAARELCARHSIPFTQFIMGQPDRDDERYIIVVQG